MIFPEISPLRSECLQQVTDALRSEHTRLYVDANVLIHCYEMSRSACEELLVALDGLGGMVRIPVWSAKETWDHTRGPPSRRPLASTAGRLTKHLGKFRTESLRYVDERSFDDMSMEQYSTAVEELVATGESLARRAEGIEPGHAAANARLLPFIASHSLGSDMPAIYDEVQRTGEQRYAHEVPPGFADGTPGNADEDDANEAGQLKGKKRNRFGDLIMWLEALQDCARDGAENLIVLTRDNSKRDWVYKPERVVGEDGRLQQNGGLVTLPLPLLTQEARHRCPSLTGVHVISLEMLTQVLRSGFGVRAGNLVRALQSSTRVSRQPLRRAQQRDEGTSDDVSRDAVEVTFGSGDMMFEPEGDAASTPIWQQVLRLRAEGWTAQNAAAAALAGLVPEATADEAKQVGRGIVAASNEDAVGPPELANQLLGNMSVPLVVRANLLVGLLGQTYFDENGEPKKPAAHPDVTSVLFAHSDDVDTRRAYEVTVGLPLEPIRRLYLALPNEPPRTLQLELRLNGNTLRDAQVNGRSLLEADAPPSRQLVGGGRAEQVPVSHLIAALAREFVVPATMVVLEGPSNFQIDLPERIGFISWGPSSGEELR